MWIPIYYNQKSPECNSAKIFEKRKKQQLTENQNSTAYRNISKMGDQFLHLAYQGEVCTLALQSVTPLL